ncbi:glycosyl hydrolase [Botrimarina sp.]|uniref:glycosyl hydrolase n=1 Tax=Botrimarina sp. TaxID=2795802 RepID=UPI0032EE8444
MLPRPLAAHRWIAIAAACVALAAAPLARSQTIDQLRAAFAEPPAAARPWVFWYWMHGRVSEEGITADLQAMKRAGLSGAYLMPIQGPTDPPEYEPLAVQLSPRFWRMVRHAAAEARRLGLELGMHACDGFATAGGPWITPELSMQKLVWSETPVTGGQQADTQLARPEAYDGFYRDVAVLALPLPPGHGATTEQIAPRVTSSDQEPGLSRLASPKNTERYRSEAPCWIEYAFDEPFTARSVTVTPDGRNYQCQRLLVSASDDGADWREVARLDAPRHGWQEEGLPVTHALPETTARRFRFSWDPAGSEPGAEDLDNAKWSPVLKVQSIVLSSAPRVHHWRGKSGAVWRQSPPTTEELAPQRLCVPLAEIIDLTDRVDSRGRLRWDAPPGEWLVMRLGHTSTGRENATGGGGRGLECDKMNADAARLQFDRWFGEAQRQIADELGRADASRVLSTLHVDSWECGAQNWTADLPAVFQKQHGDSLLKWLPAMAGVPIESAEASERVLHDLRETLAELYVERFYGTLRRLADESGVRFTGECTAPTMPGDGLRHFAYLDAPMGEFWLDSPTHDKPTDMRDAVSGAHAHGKHIVQAEAFTQLRIAWDETPARLKRLGDLQLALGANRFVIHVWTHNPWLERKPGQTLGGVGLFFQRDQPWARHASGWTDYLARCQAVLQAGEPVVDIGVAITGDLPRRSLTPGKLVDRLPGLFGQEAVEREQARRENFGRPLRELPVGVRASANIPRPDDWTDPLGGYKYDSLNPDALAAGAGQRYAFLHKPNDPPWTEPDLDGVPPDFRAFTPEGARAENIAWTHRRGEGWDAYLVANQTGEPRALRLSLRATGDAVELWDPLTGARQRADANHARRTELGLSLEANQSMLVVLTRQSDVAQYEEPTGSGRIEGPWLVRFDAAVGDDPPDLRLEGLADLSQRSELRAFAGEAAYTTTFKLEEPLAEGVRLWLDVGRAEALARVAVNGVDCGVAWTAPYRVDVTRAVRPGENMLRVTTPSVWKNALIADRSLPKHERTTWTSAPVRLADEAPARFGLLGPARLLTQKPIE